MLVEEEAEDVQEEACPRAVRVRVKGGEVARPTSTRSLEAT